MTNSSGDPVHFAFPFARGADGKAATALQGSPEHIHTQAFVVASYPKGYRLDEPEFGITWPDFGEAPIDADGIATEIKAWVPEANITATEAADIVSAARRNVTVEVES